MEINEIYNPIQPNFFSFIKRKEKKKIKKYFYQFVIYIGEFNFLKLNIE